VNTNVVSHTEGEDRTRKAATAARMYDYYLGGVHNFPADQEAAKKIIAQYPSTPAAARANRAFLRRAVRFLVDAGVRQFLDIGSGMPTVGNVHEIAQQAAPDCRVVYVDIDPVAVAESLEILQGNPLVTAIRGDVRVPEKILGHGQVRKLLDLDQPVGLLMVALLHFVPDDELAYAAVSALVDALAPASYLVISHISTEGMDLSPAMKDAVERGRDVYRRQTASPVRMRSIAETTRFFTTADLVEPGVVPVPLWRPEPDDPTDFADNPARSTFIGGVGKIHSR
jgi:hypothetical protein